MIVNERAAGEAYAGCRRVEGGDAQVWLPMWLGGGSGEFEPLRREDRWLVN